MKACSLILIVAVGLSLSFSCSEEVKPTPYTYTQVFTGKNSKTWQIKYFEETANGKVTNRFNVSCTADDKYTFHAGSERIFETASGSRKCFDPAEDDVISNVWTFNNATATLTMIIPVLSENSLPYIVREVDSESMVLEIFFDETGTGSYRIHFESTSEN
ncbi:MAG TPA: hypothetical protein VIN08_18910 [Ohtaekwangia sp.]|uniref:hypothetical protein n=1 Tax=Ohtaekwangia sp. TaxID=2066019 RepID=UPI002F91C389